ncbi:MAG: dehydrogenase [Bacilli bacterium]|nr:dehydrogenase [Bacilli bacterium]
MSEENKPEDDQDKPAETPALEEVKQAEAAEIEEVKPLEAAPSAEASVNSAPETEAPVLQKQTPEEKAAKVKAAAEAREARAIARAAEKAAEESTIGGEGAPETVKEPSVNQPLLDRIVQLLKENVSPDVVEEAYINEKDSDLPTVVLQGEHWLACANILKNHTELKLNYLRNLTGTDQETHLEAVYHLVSLSTKRDYCIKVKTNREQPSIPSVTGIWPTANWNEREAYDLLGIDFSGHPNMTRIMMPDDWVGYPLRKDYEPLDPEV